MKLITIRESHYLSDLAVIKSKLESEGIRCFLKDELSAQVLTHLSSMNVELQIYESDLQKAKSVLKEMGEYISTKTEVIICPFCDSAKVSLSPKPGNMIKFYLRYFSNQLMITSRKTLYNNLAFNCLNCKKTFINK